MAEVVVDVEKRRRLPPWMLGVAAADKVGNSENENQTHLSEDVGPASKSHQPKAKPRAKRLEREVLFHDNESLEVDSTLLEKCETKNGKRKSIKKDVDCDGPVPYEGGLQKKRAKKGSDGVQRTVQEPAPPKKRNAENCGPEHSNEIKIPLPNGEDGELTMEDLMSIAEEYVKADKEMEHQQSSATVPKAKTQLHATVFSRNKSSLETTQNTGKVPTHDTIVSASDITETRWKDQKSSTNRDIAINLSRTGDPSQDMLDLFLGPLLKKPPSKENKFEFITEDMTLTYESRKQNQIKVNGEEGIPLMKKKTSLKDKIAMFLD